VHSAAFGQHSHNITTHNCDIAHCESYVIVAGRRGNLTILIGGRYLDRLERREGRWKIALRRHTSALFDVNEGVGSDHAIAGVRGFRGDLIRNRPGGRCGAAAAGDVDADTVMRRYASGIVWAVTGIRTQCPMYM
jgi:hypothetical protein